MFQCRLSVYIVQKPQTWQSSVIFSDLLLVFSIPLSCMRSRKRSRRQLGNKAKSHPVGTRADLDCIHQLICTFGQCMTVCSKSGNPFYNVSYACQATSVLGAWTGHSPIMSWDGHRLCVLCSILLSRWKENRLIVFIKSLTLFFAWLVKNSE